jgi:hypothetical protein
MVVPMILMIVLSLLALAAHFLRAGHPVLVLAVLAALALLVVRRPWAARTIQIVLLGGAVEWVRTTLGLAMARLDAGEPYIRMVLILGGVTLVTLVSALTFQTERMRRLNGLVPPPEEEP